MPTIATERTLVVLVSLHLKVGREDEWLSLLTPVLDAMRHEPTFVNAMLYRDPDDPTRFMLYETWADRDDLVNVQMKRGYRSAYEARLPDLLREPRQAQVWRRLRADFTFFAEVEPRPLLARITLLSTVDRERGHTHFVAHAIVREVEPGTVRLRSRG